MSEILTFQKCQLLTSHRKEKGGLPSSLHPTRTEHFQVGVWNKPIEVGFVDVAEGDVAQLLSMQWSKLERGTGFGNCIPSYHSPYEIRARAEDQSSWRPVESSISWLRRRNSCTIIGAGNFGTVYKALLSGRWAALKVPKEGCSGELFRTTLQEIKILCYLGTHENVLAFIGAYIKEIGRGIVQIATELCENGTLLSHLRGVNRSVSATKRDGCPYELVAPFDLERFCFEVAAGMDYLTCKQTFTCKIGDFGLSRKLYEYEKYVKESQEPIPWRWVAPEGLRKMEFSSKSDVWSYGVTLWEIYSLGDVPYPGLNWNVNFVDDLENGLRLQKPIYCVESTYGKLLECWNIEAGSRPTFAELAQFFQSLRQKLYATFHDD